MSDLLLFGVIFPSWGLGLLMGLMIGMWFKKDKDAEGA